MFAVWYGHLRALELFSASAFSLLICLFSTHSSPVALPCGVTSGRLIKSLTCAFDPYDDLDAHAQHKTEHTSVINQCALVRSKHLNAGYCHFHNSALHPRVLCTLCTLNTHIRHIRWLYSSDHRDNGQFSWDMCVTAVMPADRWSLLPYIDSFHAPHDFRDGRAWQICGTRREFQSGSGWTDLQAERNKYIIVILYGC